MKFRVDENLPVELADILEQAGYNAETVHPERLTGVEDKQLVAICLKEGRTLITLDMGFANIRTYPPNEFPGLIVLRAKRQDKHYVLNLIQKLIPELIAEEVMGKLWIVEEQRIRIRS